MVFLDLRAIVQRHFPAAEIDQLGASLDMSRVKWRSFQRHAAPEKRVATRWLSIGGPSVLLPESLKTGMPASAPSAPLIHSINDLSRDARAKRFLYLSDYGRCAFGGVPTIDRTTLSRVAL
jgi:hypothetical protein